MLTFVNQSMQIAIKGFMLYELRQILLYFASIGEKFMWNSAERKSNIASYKKERFHPVTGIPTVDCLLSISTKLAIIVY